MPAHLRLWLLGGFHARVDSRPVAEEAWRRNKAKAVEAALSTYQRLGAVPRQQAVQARLLALA